MAVLLPISVTEVSGLDEFCAKFDINSKYIAGDDGTDEELIILELNKIYNKKFVLNFIEDRTDGYFLIQVFE
ncbi:hypothetical protein OAQ99_06200 [Candidatus Kapabacteria bacterium]|nr:hypothetical protein [Candidatus Kapabacteria bacterium]